MKKIISLFVAVAMLVVASSSVFAAAKNYPVGYAPKGAVTLTKNSFNSTSGVYTYTLKIDLSDLGTLTNTYDADSDSFGGIRIGSLAFNISGTTDMTIKKATTGTFTGSTLDSSYFSNTTVRADGAGINFLYACSDSTIAFPGADLADQTANSLASAVVIKFTSKAGSISLNNAQIGYATFANGALDSTYEVSMANITFDKTSLTIGDPATVLGMTVTQQGVKHNNGYVWKADVTKGATNPTALTADFEAGAQKTQRQIKNISDVTSKFSGSGTLSFNIGLKTTKELTKATFTITDASGSVVVPATVNK